MSTTVCNVKKSISVPECFSDQVIGSACDNIYYEEAWDLRMARLGVDIGKLNDEFTESCHIQVEDTAAAFPKRVSSSECVLGPDQESDGGEDDEALPPPPPQLMTQSCLEPQSRAAVMGTGGIIRMTASAIADSVIANNPVYSFKPSLDSTCSSSQSCPAPSAARGLLLNNECYELSQSPPPPSTLALAMQDRETTPTKQPKHTSRDQGQQQLLQSAFRALGHHNHHGQQQSQPQRTQIREQAGFCTLPLYGFSRQISAPADTTGDAGAVAASIYHANTAGNQDSGSATLEWGPQRRRSVKQSGRQKQQQQHHLYDMAAMSQDRQQRHNGHGSGSGESTYIRHLKGQEIARTLTRQGVAASVSTGPTASRHQLHQRQQQQQPQVLEDHRCYHLGTVPPPPPIGSSMTLHDSRRLDMIADSNRPLEEHLWYHPQLSRVAAEQLLSKYPEGSFLVRPSQSAAGSTDEYSLSIRYKQKWLHMKITRDSEGLFVLGQYSQPYPSIPIMIRHYSCSYLPVKGANLISLTQPIFRL